MPTMKTPGVYIVEKSLLPPSVAQVATAIPAFIGYTEKAEKRAPDDLRNKPKKISSMLEFRELFGGSPPLAISKVNLDSNNRLVEAEVDSDYLLFDSIQLFFANGGGDCYVVSVGSYEDPIQSGDLKGGLDAVSKEDEPTLLLFPDGVLLTSATDFYDLQKAALAQCGEKQDRFAILDLREHDSNGNFDWEGQKDEFRSGIGTENLKYGAAYAPHLQTSLGRSVQYKDFHSVLTKSMAPVNLKALTSDDDYKEMIEALDVAVSDLELVETEFDSDAPGSLATDLISQGVLKAYSENLTLALDFLYNKTMSTKSLSDYRTMLKSLYEVIVVADGWMFDTTSSEHTSSTFQQDSTLISDISKPFIDTVEKILALDKAADQNITGTNFKEYKNFPPQDANNYPSGWVDGSITPNNDAFSQASNNTERVEQTLPLLRLLFEQIIGHVKALLQLARSRMESRERTLREQYPYYKNLLEELNDTLSVIPPSGAVAGVYATVDRTRGVWKAPANVSLNNVADLTRKFTTSETDGLNVHETGKSINAIRFFTGRGHLVFGARTLAGNDNEWRYVSVRRFFNMVEESVMKSTRWAVFEPNDASTWAKVKGMIENFLTLQWREGALQGAKPDEAFYVKIGLGQTMTPTDILEGRMNVEIGMAVVRPAEFIVLTFMHKMVES